MSKRSPLDASVKELAAIGSRAFTEDTRFLVLNKLERTYVDAAVEYASLLVNNGKPVRDALNDVKNLVSSHVLKEERDLKASAAMLEQATQSTKKIFGGDKKKIGNKIPGTHVYQDQRQKRKSGVFLDRLQEATRTVNEAEGILYIGQKGFADDPAVKSKLKTKVIEVVTAALISTLS